MKVLLAIFALVVVVWTKPSENSFNKNNAVKHFSRSQSKQPMRKPSGNESEISAAIVIQNSRELVSTLLKMRWIAPEVTNRLERIGENWIGSYTYWEFDDKQYDYVRKTPFADEIASEISDAVDARRSAPFVCQNLKLIDTLIDVLTDTYVTTDMEVFVYIYGGIELAGADLYQLMQLINQMQAKIHIIQNAASAACFNQNFNDPHLSILADIAQYSGGLYSLSGDGASLLALPLQYDSQTVTIQQQTYCQDVQRYEFTVNDNPWMLSFLLYGDIEGEPTVIGPDGTVFEVNLIYKSLVDRLYYINIDNPVSGVFKLQHGIYESSNSFGCGLRVDKQS